MYDRSSLTVFVVNLIVNTLLLLLLLPLLILHYDNLTKAQLLRTTTSTTTASSSDYDKYISTSTHGEPVFRLQPNNVINFSPKRGAVLLCLASGSPRPSISWFVSPAGLDASQQTSLHQEDLTSSYVTNVTNLRVILNNGSAIRLLPFKLSDYRQDIHSAEYRCVASNQVATIHSRSALVQAGEYASVFSSSYHFLSFKHILFIYLYMCVYGQPR